MDYIDRFLIIDAVAFAQRTRATTATPTSLLDCHAEHQRTYRHDCDICCVSVVRSDNNLFSTWSFLNRCQFCVTRFNRLRVMQRNFH